MMMMMFLLSGNGWWRAQRRRASSRRRPQRSVLCRGARSVRWSIGAAEAPPAVGVQFKQFDLVSPGTNRTRCWVTPICCHASFRTTVSQTSQGHMIKKFRTNYGLELHNFSLASLSSGCVADLKKKQKGKKKKQREEKERTAEEDEELEKQKVRNEFQLSSSHR